MREKKAYCVITFHTTAEAMACERLCHDHNLPGRLIPVPRELSAGCGLAWRTPRQDFSVYDAWLEEIEYEAVETVYL